MAKRRRQRGDVINHTPAEEYVPPEEPEVLRKLEWFKDQKLGFMVHWGVYSQLGMTESWPISDGDAHWSRRGYDWEKDSKRFRAQYFAMNRTFNPIRFNPEEWADFAAKVGFRYFIFSTKHHDGFCMYDTKYSDYRVTAPDCPFSENRYRDIAGELFKAFRKKKIAIAPYFSKPDWHCPWYWAEGCEKPVAYNRNPTYAPEERPDLWKKFTEFTQNQMLELVRDYGPVEILWLDGGQVDPKNGQDIRMAEFAKKARKIKPDLLIVDRTIGGPYENYITPEYCVPDDVLECPWESCVPVGGGFAYGYDDNFKTPGQLVKLLIDVVSRGGNLALNLGAQPDGRLPRRGMETLLKLGEWLDGYGEAIFGTRPACGHIKKDGFAFTKKGRTVYALLPTEGRKRLPSELTVPWDKPVTHVSVLPTDEKLPFEKTPRGLKIKLPRGLKVSELYALVLKLT